MQKWGESLGLVFWCTYFALVGAMSTHTWPMVWLHEFNHWLTWPYGHFTVYGDFFENFFNTGGVDLGGWAASGIGLFVVWAAVFWKFKPVACFFFAAWIAGWVTYTRDPVFYGDVLRPEFIPQMVVLILVALVIILAWEGKVVPLVRAAGKALTESGTAGGTRPARGELRQVPGGRRRRSGTGAGREGGSPDPARHRPAAGRGRPEAQATRLDRVGT